MREVKDLGPNAHLIGEARSRLALATPSIILDLKNFEFNLSKMATLCTRAGILLRPHAKTHKSIEIAKRQLAAGAVGISVATLREATVMVNAGLPGVLLTTPIFGPLKIDLVCDLAGKSAGFMVAVDSAAYVKALEMALRKRGKTLTVLVDIDIGMGRTGIPDLKGAQQLIRRVRSSDVLELAGLQCYSGMVQHIRKAADRARTYGKQLRHLEAILSACARNGYTPRIVSGGGTGTFDFDRRAGLFTECQCGSYAFMDLQYGEVQLFAGEPNPYRTALFVQCTVVSNHVPGLSTIDGGSKCFAMDGPVPRPERGVPAGTKYFFFGDEFGKIQFARKSAIPKLGSKIELVTPHCDPTVNLHDYYHCVRGNKLVDIWPIDARGSL